MKGASVFALLSKKCLAWENKSKSKTLYYILGRAKGEEKPMERRKLK